MDSLKLDDDQIARFRSVLNRSLQVLRPQMTKFEPIHPTEHELKLIAAALGTEGTAREVEAYVALEQEKWKDVPMRIEFLDSLMVVVADEIQKFEFYRDPVGPRKFPLPERVAVFNADKGVHDRTIPIEEFLEDLRSVVRSSVFKR